MHAAYCLLVNTKLLLTGDSLFFSGKIMYTVNKFKPYLICSNGDPCEYIVHESISTDNYPDLKNPAAIFPINHLFSKEFQEKQADTYAGYLNKLRQATVTAFQENNLADVLARETT